MLFIPKMIAIYRNDESQWSTTGTSANHTDQPKSELADGVPAKPHHAVQMASTKGAQREKDSKHARFDSDVDNLDNFIAKVPDPPTLAQKDSLQDMANRIDEVHIVIPSTMPTNLKVCAYINS